MRTLCAALEWRLLLRLLNPLVFWRLSGGATFLFKDRPRFSGGGEGGEGAEGADADRVITLRPLLSPE